MERAISMVRVTWDYLSYMLYTYGSMAERSHVGCASTVQVRVQV